MKRTSTRFFALLLVLLSIGAFDLHSLLNANESGWPVATAAPLPYTAAGRLQERSRKPRVGVVITNSGSSTGGGGTLNAVAAAEDSAFGKDGRVGMKVQLKMLERDVGSDPLMLYQRHVNKANTKLASILGIEPPSPSDQLQALERRRTAIARRSAPPHTPARQGYTTLPSPSAMQRRFLSFFDNLFTGSKAKSAVAQPSAGYPEADLVASQSDNLTIASRPTAIQSLGLDIESNDIGYIASIQLGSQNETFRMLIDSGSADTWVPSTSCAACGSTHKKLGPSNSDTFKSSKEAFSIQYGTGDVSGRLATDTMTIAGLTLNKYTFAVTTQESSDFADDTVPFDGLMGLARSELSNARQPTPIDALFEAGKVQAPVMGYHLGRLADGVNDGEVTFGGVDPEMFTGNITEIPNVSTRGFWEAPIQSVSVAGTDLNLSNRTAILDTGTTLIVAPTDDADALHAAIPGSKSDGQGGYTIPCTTSAQLAFGFGGEVFPVDTRDLLFVPVDANDLKGDCVSAVSAGNVGQQGEWLVGATFLKNVYFATNTEANRIGLAKLNGTLT